LTASLEPASSALPQGGARRPGPVRRVTTWIEGWHGGQLATLWAAAFVVPWRVGVWGHLLINQRLGAFVEPGYRSPGLLARTAEAMAYFVLPLMAVIATGIWLAGRRRAAEE
jgi:hypothetical protein